MRISGGIVAAVAALALPTAAAAQAPQMSRTEVMQMFAAGGFPANPAGTGVLDRCGRPAKPRVRFIDLNNDKQDDALFVDSGPCYGADKQWFSVATRIDGTWRRVVGVTGTAKGLQTSTNGWQDILWTSDGQQQTLRFDGTRYVGDDGLPPEPGQAEPASVPSNAYPTDGWPKGIKAASLTDAQFAEIMSAGGYALTGGAWHGCGGSTTITPGDVELKDINGDGRPEAVVIEESVKCFGTTEQGFQVLRPVRGGWQSMLRTTTGIPSFLKTHGSEGFSDIEVGGPGFCFPMLRWNGSAYRQAGYSYDGKACRP